MKKLIITTALTAAVLTGCSMPAGTSTSRLATESSRQVVAVPTTQAFAGTRSQEQAVRSAQSYLRSSAFSKLGLVDQLEYEQFSTADAMFAVEYLEAHGEVDWKVEAVRCGQSYLRSSSFSLASLTEQLEYEKFTPAEAAYGAQAAYGNQP